MSGRPTLVRLAAVAAVLLVPASASADDEHRDSGARCERGDAHARCVPASEAPEQGPVAPVVLTRTVTPPAPAPAPAEPAREASEASSTSAASSRGPVSITIVEAAEPRTCIPPAAIRLRLDDRGRVRTARATLDGRALHVTRGARGRASVLVDLRRRGAGPHTLRTRVVTRGGRLVEGARRYVVCG